MSNRTLVWTLAALAVVLVLVPFVGLLTWGGGMMGGGWTGDAMMGGGMAAMHVSGLLWLILTIVVVAALVAVLVRGETKA